MKSNTIAHLFSCHVITSVVVLYIYRLSCSLKPHHSGEFTKYLEQIKHYSEHDSEAYLFSGKSSVCYKHTLIPVFHTL